MAGSLREWRYRAEQWWDTTCAVCLGIRGAVYLLARFLYVGAVFIGLVVIVEWYFDTGKPYKIHGIKLAQLIVAPGDHVRVMMDLEKTRLCPGTEKRSLGGACGNIFVVTKPTTLPVGRQPYEADLPVPEDAPDGGICIARISVEYACNPWDYLFPEEQFLAEIPFTVRKHAPFIENAPP